MALQELSELDWSLSVRLDVTTVAIAMYCVEPK